jgi:catalase
VAAYSPNTLNNGSPKQANQTVGNGFFTTPSRSVSGNLVRAVSSTFSDVWSQPRLFFNSLIPVEQQFLINAIRFEVSHVQSAVVKSNVLIQLNRVSNDIAKRVAAAIGLPAPPPDPTFYNNNSTAFVTIFGKPLLSIAGLNVGVLASTNSTSSLSQAAGLAQAFAAQKVVTTIVAETLAPGVNQTYSAADATGFDGIIVAAGAEKLFAPNATASTFFPAGRPLQILSDGYRWGKPVGALGPSAATVLAAAGATTTPGVYTSNANELSQFVTAFEAGLMTFKFIDRFPIDQ